MRPDPVRRPTPRPSALVESLEPRTFLAAGPLPYETYFPEGFASSSILQQVDLASANATDTDWSLEVRYEVGQRDQVLSTGTIHPDARASVLIADPAHPSSVLARPGEPYALVLRSSAPLAASFLHRDFGNVLGASFTSATSTTWTFADVRQAPGVLSFILFYNPDDTPTSVAVSFYSSVGLVRTLTSTLGPQRRGGWALQDIPTLPAGRYGVVVTGGAPIVASLSTYGLSPVFGIATLGDDTAGSAAGLIPTLDLERRFTDLAPSGTTSPSAHATIAVFNPALTPANVTLSFVTDSPSIPPITRTLTVPARSRAELDLSTVGLLAYFSYALAYSSSVPVTVSASSTHPAGGAALQAVAASASAWTFAGGVMPTTRAGAGAIESLSIYNPASVALDVFLDLLLDSGEVLSLAITIEPRRAQSVSTHAIDELIQRGGTQAYAIRLSAASDFIAAYQRWDDSLPGGFAAQGSPEGITSFLSGNQLP